MKKMISVTLISRMTIFVVIVVIGLVMYNNNFQNIHNQKIPQNVERYEYFCKDILVKSITVYIDNIQIYFSSSPSVQVVGRKSNDGNVEPFEYSNNFIVQKGDNIYWGDGDHAFHYLTLDNIDNKQRIAYITYQDEFVWNGKTTSKIQKCKILGMYAS